MRFQYASSQALKLGHHSKQGNSNVLNTQGKVRCHPRHTHHDSLCSGKYLIYTSKKPTVSKTIAENMVDRFFQNAIHLVNPSIPRNPRKVPNRSLLYRLPYSSFGFYALPPVQGYQKYCHERRNSIHSLMIILLIARLDQQ